jgi:hypothetical protein
MDEEDIAELRENQIMSGIKEQQQRDVFGGAQAVPTQDDTEQEWVSTTPSLPAPFSLLTSGITQNEIDKFNRY